MSGLEVNHRVWGAICVDVGGEAERHVDIEGRALELGCLLQKRSGVPDQLNWCRPPPDTRSVYYIIT
jgi:hypothetical protein